MRERGLNIYNGDNRYREDCIYLSILENEILIYRQERNQNLSTSTNGAMAPKEGPPASNAMLTKVKANFTPSVL